MLLLALAVGLAGPPVPVPTTVNDQELGKAEQFSYQGPGRVCLRESYIDLNAGETAYLAYSGIHSLRVEIRTSDTILKVSEGEAWAKPKHQQNLLLKRDDMAAYEVGDETNFRYLVYGANRYSEGKFVPMIWLDGTALAGDASDKALVGRLHVGTPSESECMIHYNYGWGVLLEGEPVVTHKNEVK